MTKAQRKIRAERLINEIARIKHDITDLKSELKHSPYKTDKPILTRDIRNRQAYLKQAQQDLRELDKLATEEEFKLIRQYQKMVDEE